MLTICFFYLRRKGLQQCTDILEQYCNRWKLNVNLDKTKIMIFNSCKKIGSTDVKYGNSSTEQVYTYQYLGVNILDGPQLIYRQKKKKK